MAVADVPATSRDESVTRSDLDILEARLRAELAALESRLLWRLLGGIGALLALFRLLDLLPS